LIANIELWLARTNLRKNRYQKAVSSGLKAYSIASGMQMLLIQKEASFELSEAYEKNGNIKEALNWRKSFQIHSDSLRYFNQQKEIKRIEARYNYQKKEKENELLRNKASLQEQIIRNRNVTAIALIAGIILSIIMILLLFRRNKDAKLLYKQQQMINIHKLEEIENELDGKKRELASKMMFLNQKNDLLSRIIKKL